MPPLMLMAKHRSQHASDADFLRILSTLMAHQGGLELVDNRYNNAIMIACVNSNTAFIAYFYDNWMGIMRYAPTFRWSSKNLHVER